MKKIIIYILIASLFAQQVSADWSVESQELIKKIDSQNLNDDQLTQIMDLADEHKDMNLLMLAFKKLKPDAQKALAGWSVTGVFSFFSRNEKSYESSKQKVKMLSPGLDINNDVYYSAQTGMYSNKNIQEPLDFFISLGFPVNYVPADIENKKTLLDIADNLLSKYTLKGTRNLIVADREYLLSKGAKTYAGLSQAK